MPNIEDYSAGNIAIRPSETGVEAAAAAGRRLGAYGSQIAGAYERAGQALGRGVHEAVDTATNYQDHQQINAGADHGATLFSNMTESLNQTLAGADPHDPSVAKAWRDQTLEPTLQQFAEGFTTPKSREWANRFVNSQRMHFFQASEAGMSSLAKDAVSTTVDNLSTKLSNTVVNNPSPHTIDHAIGMVNSSIDDVIAANPNIKGTDAANIKTNIADKIVKNIVHAGVLGAIMKSSDPEATAADLTARYPKYIDGKEALQFAKAAQTQVRTNTLLTKQIANEDRRQAEDQVNQARNDIWSRNVTTDANGRVQIKPGFFTEASQLPVRYGRAPNATSVAENFLRFGNAVQKGELANVSDQATKDELYGRLLSRTNPITEDDTIAAEGNRTLAHHDGNDLRSLIKMRDEGPTKDPQFKYAAEYAQQVIEGSYGGKNAMKFDEEAQGKYPAFMMNFLSEYNRQRVAGTLKPNALNVNDPNSLISQTINSYVAPLSNRIQKNGGGPPALPVYTAPSAGAAPSFAARFGAAFPGVAAPAAAAPAVSTAPKPVTTTREITISSKAEFDRLPPNTPFTYHGKKFTTPAAGAPRMLGPGEM